MPDDDRQHKYEVALWQFLNPPPEPDVSVNVGQAPAGAVFYRRTRTVALTVGEEMRVEITMTADRARGIAMMLTRAVDELDGPDPTPPTDCGDGTPKDGGR
jgi:hypothetical protein